MCSRCHKRMAVLFITKIENNESKNIVQEPVKPDPITIHMSATGDIMCHNTVYMDAYNSSKKEYD